MQFLTVWFSRVFLHLFSLPRARLCRFRAINFWNIWTMLWMSNKWENFVVAYTVLAQPKNLFYILCKYTGKNSLMLTRYLPNYDEMKFNFVDLETLVCWNEHTKVHTLSRSSSSSMHMHNEWNERKTIINWLKEKRSPEYIISWLSASNVAVLATATAITVSLLHRD